MKRLVVLLAATGLLISVSAVPVGASTSAAEQANVFEATYLGGSSTQYAYGSSSSNLGSWSDVISSLKTTTVVGHGFIFYTGTGYGGSSLKICGPTTRLTMPPGFDNTISSYRSTTLCPQ